MASETVTFSRLTCDRCGFLQDCHESRQEARWGNIMTQRKDGSCGLSTGYKAEICPACYDGFIEWYKTKSR